MQNWAWLVVALLICGVIIHRTHQQTPGCLVASRLLEVENTLYSTLEQALVPMREENTALRAELAALRAAAPVAALRAAIPDRGPLPVSVAVPALARPPTPRPEPPPKMQPPRRLSPEEAVRACRVAAKRRGAKELKHQAVLLDRNQVVKASAACEAARAPGQSQAMTVVAVPPLLLLPPPEETGQRYLLVDRAFCHGLGHEALVYNVALRLASRLKLTLVHAPLLGHKAHGDHAELRGKAAAVEAMLGLGSEAVTWQALKAARKAGSPLDLHELSRPCPEGNGKWLGKGAAQWKRVEAAVAAAPRSGRPTVFRLCGDVDVTGMDGEEDAKYAFASTGGWWRARFAHAAAAAPLAHATPLFAAGGGTLNVAVHVRRGDMVYRNFIKQLAPDAYYANVMLQLLRLLAPAGGGSSRVVFHVFTELPPTSSWTGRSKLPPLPADARYVDEFGCAADLGLQLARLAGEAPGGGHGSGGTWEVRAHSHVDALASILHMASADALVASDSSFSLLAAVLSRGLVLSMRSWKRFPESARRGLRFPLTTEPDGRFDCAEASQMWNRRGSSTE